MSLTDLRELPAAVLAGRLPPPPVSSMLGMEIVEYGEGRAKFAMNVDKRYHNPMGTVHGGIITSLAEDAMGVALMSTLEKGESFVTLELKMNFIKSVQSGRITAKGKVVHRGKTIALVESDIEDSEGNLIAKSVSTQMVLKPRSP